MYCSLCSSPLHLNNIENEKRYGLGSILYIRCQNSMCSTLNDVKTGKRTSGSFDVNSKLALAMVHSGMGPVQIGSFLSVLNLPPVEASTIKRNELKVDKSLEAVAKESCMEARREELEKGDGKMELSFDGAWQKRGTGWNRDSSTGHASFIGKETGKVLAFDWRSKTCHTCSIHQGKNHTVPAHDCCKNHEGSSKAMEPDMAISMAKEMNDSGFPIDVMHGDNDSTTAARLKAVFPRIKKKRDSNHTKKGITSKLYALVKKNTILKEKNVIPYIGRCIMYAVKECQGKEATTLQARLDTIVPHLYGDHSSCKSGKGSWCKYHNAKDKSKYRYSSLPGGKPFTCPRLRQELTRVISGLEPGELTDLGSTQANENFNFMVSTKAPKNRSFGRSRSFRGRLCATSGQKNYGPHYIQKVNKDIGLSPGEFTIRLANRTAAKRKKQKEKQSTIESKRKRVVKKIKGVKKEATNEVHEGVTYETNVEINDPQLEESIIEIPRKLEMPEKESYVVFDLETAGRKRTSDILQIFEEKNRSSLSALVFIL